MDLVAELNDAIAALRFQHETYRIAEVVAERLASKYFATLEEAESPEAIAFKYRDVDLGGRDRWRTTIAVSIAGGCALHDLRGEVPNTLTLYGRSMLVDLAYEAVDSALRDVERAVADAKHELESSGHWENLTASQKRTFPKVKAKELLGINPMYRLRGDIPSWASDYGPSSFEPMVRKQRNRLAQEAEEYTAGLGTIWKGMGSRLRKIAKAARAKETDTTTTPQPSGVGTDMATKTGKKKKTTAKKKSTAKKKAPTKESAKPAEVTGVRDLEQIAGRHGGNTRKLNAENVVLLAESINALGLLEPIVVDRENRLLAGGHRLAALRLLSTSEENRQEWLDANTANIRGRAADQAKEATNTTLGRLPAPDALDVSLTDVPVRVIDIDSAIDQDRALEVEIAENTQRRDYTPQEVKSIYDQLLNAGYVEGTGRPKKGAKAAKPVLAAVIGKNARTVRKLLKRAKEEGVAESRPANLLSTVKKAEAQVQSAIRKLEGWPEKDANYDTVTEILVVLQQGQEQLTSLNAHFEVEAAEAQILAYLAEAGEPRSPSEIREALKIYDELWVEARKHLVEANKIVGEGHGAGQKYKIGPEAGQEPEKGEKEDELDSEIETVIDKEIERFREIKRGSASKGLANMIGAILIEHELQKPEKKMSKAKLWRATLRLLLEKAGLSVPDEDDPRWTEKNWPLYRTARRAMLAEESDGG